MEDDDELVMSPLCQWITEQGHTIRVEIYRGQDTGWILEVVDESDTSIVWDDQFATDQSALDEVLRILREDGMESLVVPPDDAQ